MFITRAYNKSTWTSSRSSKWKHAVGKNTYNDRAKQPPAFLKKLLLVTIQTSTMIPLSATVSRKCVGVGGWGGTVVTNAFHSYNAKKI